LIPESHCFSCGSMSITNARDALNQKYPGYHEDKVINLHCSLHKQDGVSWMRITIEDRGPGIPEGVRNKMFEPFFTTKSRELGTGLGLAISYGIIQDHRGRIVVETDEGEYTRFHVDLPMDEDRLGEGRQG